MRNETTLTIAEWSRQTFGAVNPLDVVRRAMEEVNELFDAIDYPADDETEHRARVLDEVADVIIVLCRLGHEYGPLWEAVERKMAINRTRTWNGWRHVE